MRDGKPPQPLSQTSFHLDYLTSSFPCHGHSRTLFIFVRSACAIPDPDNEELIITGGWDTMTKATVYNEDGWQRDLPSFSEGRRHHACSSFLNKEKKVIIS